MKKLNRTLLLLSIIFFSFTGFSQQTQLWNYQSLYNPANNGLYYKHLASAAHNFGAGKLALWNASVLSYSTYLENHKMGVGINVSDARSTPSGWSGPLSNTDFKLGANKQFAIGEGRIISAGLAAGVAINTQVTHVVFEQPFFTRYKNEPIFTSDFGIAFRSRRLNLSSSVTHFLNNSNDTLTNPKRIGLYGFGSYSFGNNEGLEIIPNTTLKYERHLFAQIMVLAKYKSKYMLGIGLTDNEDLISTIGITLKEKFRLTYSFLHRFEVPGSFNYDRHEINLAFLLKRKDL